MVQTDLVQDVQRLLHWSTSSLPNLLITLGVVFVTTQVFLPFFTNWHAAFVPGPFLAKFTDLWLLLQAKRGNRYEVVHALHKKHGKFVRLAPNHVSIADHEALQAVYGHSTGTLKPSFYSAFVPPRPFPRGLFNTQDRAEHTRKRKIVSHSFAPKSITNFEPFIRREAQLLLERFDEFADKAKKAPTRARAASRVTPGSTFCSEFVPGRERWRRLILSSTYRWMNYWAFDTIGTLAFGAAFGMLESGEDRARVEYEDPSTGKVKVEHCSAIQIINERGEYSATMGCAPEWMRSTLVKLPWFSQRLKSVKKLSGIALARVNDRLVNGSEREDLLALLQAGKDDKGETMEKMELTAEALTQLIAGSDTTSNTACAVLYHLATHPQFLRKLQAELDENLSHAEDVPLYSDVQELPYLNAVLQESLRYHSTSAIGLPRVLPAGGAVICGKFFPGGSVVSVPAYTIHRTTSIFGADAEKYNPERWLAPGAAKKFEKSFVPFGTGPRSCIGRHVALMELNVVLASLVRRYDFELKDPKAQLETVEGFLRKPVELQAGFKRRA